MQFKEVDSDEILTGVKLFKYLLEKNTSNLESEREKIHEYTKLYETLNSITNYSRRQVLAPVAEGLAYFDAELISTNNILVLLGENWFAERSAVQAAAIAERRIDFLRREVKVLEEERRILQERQEMLASEIPEANIAMTKLMEKTEEGLSKALMASHGPCGEAEIPKSSVDITVGKESVAQDLVDQAVADNPELAVFDEQDELTEEELSELEKELADVLDNDEIVERVLTARMIAKKERRIKAEMGRADPTETFPSFRTDKISKCVQHTIRSLQHNQSECRVSAEPIAALSKPFFSSPADIGFRECNTGPEVNLSCTTFSSSIEKASTLPEHSIMNEGNSLLKAKKRVTFSSEDPKNENISSSSLKLPISPSIPDNKPINDEVMTKKFQPEQGFIHDTSISGRKCFVIGDIVERDFNEKSKLIPVSDSIRGTTSSKKHRSLYKRQLEGKNDDAV